MPFFEYECTACGKIEVVFQKFSDKPLAKCRHCSGKLHKLISQSTFHLKGTGWYVTDYAEKSNGPAAASKKSKKASSTDSTTTVKDEKQAKKSTD